MFQNIYKPLIAVKELLWNNQKSSLVFQKIMILHIHPCTSICSKFNVSSYPSHKHICQFRPGQCLWWILPPSELDHATFGWVTILATTATQSTSIDSKIQKLLEIPFVGLNNFQQSVMNPTPCYIWLSRNFLTGASALLLKAVIKSTWILYKRQQLLAYFHLINSDNTSEMGEVPHAIFGFVASFSSQFCTSICKSIYNHLDPSELQPG